MRTLFLGTAAALSMLATGGATAQTRVISHGPGAGYRTPGMRPMPAPRPHVARWGSRVGGHWWGGVNAPGGWNAYRRPVRGYALPRYWVAPRFFVADWSSYGLARPPVGYNWARYYDDAVLIDGRGSVYDSVSGVNWDGDQGYADGGYSDGGYADDRYADGPPPPPRDRRGDGLGGAAVGAVAGGVAGNLIAGRGNRLGGTLIGAGVGAAAGYAIDRSDDRRDGYREDRHGRPPMAPLPPRAPYADGYDGPHHPPRLLRYEHGPSSWVSPDGSTTVVTNSGGGFYGANTTTITVQTQPVVTTTTTTTYEDAVTYSRPVARRVYKKRWVKPRCGCR
jgi:Ni/Co efflux regulator RcnB